jgi:hypothetical protein
VLRKMRLIPDETTAPIVRRIYHDYHAGASLRGLAASLTADAIPTPTGGTTWDANTVRWILWHPTYWGEPAALRWQSEPVPKAVRDQYKHQSRQVRRPAEQQIALDAAIAAPPLVSPELAGAVHARLRAQQVLGTANHHNRYPEAALLRGHAYCADCEHALAAHGRRRQAAAAPSCGRGISAATPPAQTPAASAARPCTASKPTSSTPPPGTSSARCCAIGPSSSTRWRACGS